MISGQGGVVVQREDHWTGAGVQLTAFELRWRTEPGWLTLETQSPTLFMASKEVGGRCELRPRMDAAGHGEYFGPGALTFVQPDVQVCVHATQIREARVCCLAFQSAVADYLSAPQVESIARSPNRFMFSDERVRTCAKLLDSDGASPGASPAYALSLAKAVMAAVVELKAPPQAPAGPILTGKAWSRTCDYFRDHLNDAVTVDQLAAAAEIAPERMSRAFLEATGSSIQRWHMDMRVCAAQRLLVDNPDVGLADVAAECGFADQSHFSRAFLKVVGATPTAWLHGRT